MKKLKKTFTAAKARNTGQRPFHVDKRKVLKEDRSTKGRRVELVQGRRGRRYGCDVIYEVRYEIRSDWPIDSWMKIIKQTTRLRIAERVFEDCLDDITTGEI